LDTSGVVGSLLFNGMFNTSDTAKNSMFRRYAIVNEEQKREALARTQQFLATSPVRNVVAMGGGK